MYFNILSKKKKKGNNCAFWYKNLNIPNSLEVNDPNCCFTFNLKNGNPIYICSNEKFRCVYPMKIILKKMYSGCNIANKMRVKSVYESENSEIPSLTEDFYSKNLFDDSSNGIWKGLVYFHQLQKQDSLTEEKNPLYMKIENKRMAFFKENNLSPELIQSFVLRNMEFPCENEKFTCDVSGFLHYYR